jgi:hypothetical protein
LLGSTVILATEGVFYVVRATQWKVFSMWSAPHPYNESVFAAKMRELGLGVQSEEPREWEYNVIELELENWVVFWKVGSSR